MIRPCSVWDLETGDCLKVLEGHADGVHSVVLIAGDKQAVSASRDNTLRIWDTQGGKCLLVIADDGVARKAVCSNTTTLVYVAGNRIVTGEIRNLT